MRIWLLLLSSLYSQTLLGNSFGVYSIEKSTRVFSHETLGEVILKADARGVATLISEARKLKIDFRGTAQESLIDIHSGRLAKSNDEKVYIIFDCRSDDGSEAGDVVVTVFNFSIQKIWNRECDL